MAEKNDGYGKRPMWQWIVIYLVIGAIIYGVVYYFFFANKGGYGGNNSYSTPTPKATTQSAVQRLDEITENEDRFMGQTVTVQGEVDRVIGRNAIVLDVPGEVVNDEILVISKSQISNSVASAEGLFSNKQARLTGTVNQFVYTTYRDTLDRDIVPDVITVFEGRPFILTDKITVAEPQ